jgi:spermidine/putrescine transport system ATP-binding protein
MSEYAVEMCNVVKSFLTPEGSTLNAVDNVSLQIKDGEFFSLLGSSGCGKTTSLRIIAGFELPTSGEMYIHGKQMGNTPPFQRPVNMVFQSYALFPHMTVDQNVGFGLKMKKVTKPEIEKRVGEALGMVKLSGMGKRTPKQLSGGQQQRVALARALVNRPEVLLLDEPLGALDLKLRKEMQLELKSLQQEVGITFIYVTHDQEEALTMSDRIAVMSYGKVLQYGTPMEIYERPNCRFVADFIGETNFLEGRVKWVENGSVVVFVPALDIDLQGVMIVPVAVGDEVTLSIRPEKIEVLDQPVLKHNCIRGTITASTYIGADTRLFIDAQGIKFRVWEQNRASTVNPTAYFKQGQEVWLETFPDSTIVLPKE